MSRQLRVNDRVRVPAEITVDLADASVRLPAGAVLVVLDVRDGDVKVADDGGHGVWVPGGFLTPEVR